MGDNETLAPPQQDEAIYTWQLADGRVVQAESHERITELCPVLAKMAIEAPDKIDAIFKLLEHSRAPRQSTSDEVHRDKPSTESPKPPTATPMPARAAKEVALAEPEPFAAETVQQPHRVESPMTVLPEPMSMDEVAAEATPAVSVSNVAEHVRRAQRELQAPLEPNGEPITTPSLEDRQPASHMVQETNDALRHQTTNPLRDFDPVVRDIMPSDHTAQEILAGYEAVTEVPIHSQAPEEEIIGISDNPAAPELAIDMPDGTPVGVEDAMRHPEESHEATLTDEPLLHAPIDAAPSETGLPPEEVEGGPVELSYDTETLDTYRQLIVLETAEASPPAPPESESEILEDIEATVPADFEALVASRATDEVTTLAAIQEQANDQPLQDTLVQLHAYLSEVVDGSAEEPPLVVILREIEALLPTADAQMTPTESDTRITPELIEKLLAFLAALGYEHPGEALVSFAAAYGMDFLLHAFDRLCQLNSDDRDKKEIITRVLTATPVSDTDSTQRLGKILARFVTRASLEQAA